MPGPHFNFSYLLPGEDLADEQFGFWATEIAERWYPLAFLIAGLYLSGLWSGQKWMHRRPAFNLRRPLILWNIFLSIFSVMGAVRNSPDFFVTLYQEGFIHSICVSDYVFYTTGWWSMLFTISKIVELGDTAFLVLRKRPVKFLHWYHHATVLLFSWHGFKEMAGPGRWFIAMNYIVHAFMYPYYLARSLGLGVPKFLQASITLMQLGQMFAGSYIAGTVAHLRWWSESTRPCRISQRNLWVAVLVYSSYFLLFLNFFFQTYIFTGKAKAGAKDPAMRGQQHVPSKKTNTFEVCNGNGFHPEDQDRHLNHLVDKSPVDLSQELRHRSTMNGYHKVN